jgi:hypothetical protein
LSAAIIVGGLSLKDRVNLAKKTVPNSSLPLLQMGTVATCGRATGWKSFVRKSEFSVGDPICVYAEALNVNRNGRIDVTFTVALKGGGTLALVSKAGRFTARGSNPSSWYSWHTLRLPAGSPPATYVAEVNVHDNITNQVGASSAQFTLVGDAQAAIAAVPAMPPPETVAQSTMTPLITSVSPILPVANQTITIKGIGFGSQASYNGDSPYIQLSDLTRNWNAGNTGKADMVTLDVTRWIDNEITIQSITGSYGGGWSLNSGDIVKVQVWNAQTGAGPASITDTVRPPSGAPVIASVSPVLPIANQTITIAGSGFGSQDPYNGNSPYIVVSDLTRNWNAGNTGNRDQVTLNVALWNDTRVVIRGFTGAYGAGWWSLQAGDRVRIQVWNAQTGMGPADTFIEVKSQ